MRTSEGSNLSFIKLNGEPVTMYRAAALFFFLTYTSPHIVLFLDFCLFYKRGWFQLCSSHSSKSENHPGVLTIFVGAICSSDLSRFRKWWAVISALPLCAAVCGRDGSLAEGCWNCAELKSVKPLKASSLAEEQNPSFNTGNCWRFSPATSDFILGIWGSSWASFHSFPCIMHILF